MAIELCEGHCSEFKQDEYLIDKHHNMVEWRNRYNYLVNYMQGLSTQLSVLQQLGVFGAYLYDMGLWLNRLPGYPIKVDMMTPLNPYTNLLCDEFRTDLMMAEPTSIDLMN
jgi:hypothetical protein